MGTITSLAPNIMQRRFAEVGRIRLGDKTEKGAPRKLTKFRITSSHADVLARIADVYGGTVQPWDDAPTGRGTQHQLYVEADHLDVLVPPGQVLTQAYELWSGGGCQRRCNGVATETGEPCVCPDDPEERAALAQKGQACKLTTRLSVWLPRVPGIGVFRLESHGFYAGMELPGVAELLAMASDAGRPIPATLRITSRVVKRDGQTKQFIVPQLDPAVPVGTMLAVARGDDVPLELAPTAVATLEAAPPAAIGPAPAAATNGQPPEAGGSGDVFAGGKVSDRWAKSIGRKLTELGVTDEADVAALVKYATGTASHPVQVAQADADKVVAAVLALTEGRLHAVTQLDGTTEFRAAATSTPDGDNDPGREF